MYYVRFGDKSALRINFETLKQDDEDEQKYIEQYLFDGVWLTHIDYQMKQVKRYQQARRNFPIVGFSRAEDLKKDFEIKLVDQNQQIQMRSVQLHLKTRTDSAYRDDYISIDFWIDRELNLPAKIVATSTEEDIYQIRLLEPKVNKEIDTKVFEYNIPKDFSVQTTPLEKKIQDKK